jgi:DNA-binding NarL/FixJ family response regulator
MQKARLIVADDHLMVAEGIRKLLEAEYELERVVPDGKELLRAVDELHPEAVLLDITMPVMNGIEAARQLARREHAPKVVFVTQQSDRRYVQAAFEAGASGYVLKQAAASELLQALHEVLEGRSYVTPSVAPLPPSGESSHSELTSRQREVLQLVAEGKSAKEIAEVLKVSPKTVEFHKGAIMDRLGIRTTAELTRYAISTGLVSS